MADVRSSTVVLPLEDSEGQKLLQQCKYGRLLPYFRKQVNSKYCGFCTAAMCLNEILENCTQNDFHLGKFSELAQLKAMQKMLQEDDILKVGADCSLLRKENVDIEGITLQTFCELIKIIGLPTSFYHVFPLQQNSSNESIREGKISAEVHTVDEFRSIALENLKKQGGHVVVNFYMAEFYPGIDFGHFSPLGGYHVKEDRFLLLDVWPRNPVGWVKTEDLFNAMAHDDSCSHMPRGFCVLNAGNGLQKHNL